MSSQLPRKPRLYCIRRVVGDSMSETLEHGQLVVALPWLSSHPGDIVVARVQGREVIKRIAAIDGDYVRLLGDNPSASTDSRDYGSLPRECIVGRVLASRRLAEPGKTVSEV